MRSGGVSGGDRGDVEPGTYAANDLMEMAGGSHAWVDKRIESLDGQLTASEPEEAMGRCSEAERGHQPGILMHLETSCS